MAKINIHHVIDLFCQKHGQQLVGLVPNMGTLDSVLLSATEAWDWLKVQPGFEPYAHSYDNGRAWTKDGSGPLFTLWTTDYILESGNVFQDFSDGERYEFFYTHTFTLYVRHRNPSVEEAPHCFDADGCCHKEDRHFPEQNQSCDCPK